MRGALGLPDAALALEQAIHQRLPERSLLDILTRAAYLTGWHRHLGPASGSDPKIRGDTLARYVLTAYAYGANLGAAEVARHMRGQVSAHELYTAGNKHSTADKVHRCSADVINAFSSTRPRWTSPTWPTSSPPRAMP
jgi:Tn3 transposase DDE domain